MMKEFRKYFYYVFPQVSLPDTSGCDLGLSSRAPGSALMWSLLTGTLVLSCQSVPSLLLSLHVRRGAPGVIPPSHVHLPGHDGDGGHGHPDTHSEEAAVVNNIGARVSDLHRAGGGQLMGAWSKLSKLDSLGPRNHKELSPHPFHNKNERNVLVNKVSINFIYLNMLLHHRYYCDDGVIIRDQFQAATAVIPPSPGHLMTR